MTPASEEQLLKDVSTLLSRQEDDHAILAGLDKTIHGSDGTPGLTTVVAGHSSTLSNVNRVFWILVTPILGSIAAGSVGLVVHFLRTVQH